MSSKEQYPARTEHFHGLEVTIYEVEGKYYLTGEDIGKCLGLAEPSIAVNKIYRRNKGELEPHIGETKLVYPSIAHDGRGGGIQKVRLFTETGANLIGMFARTAKSKEFRLWLARLPRRVRQAREGLVLPDAGYLAGAYERGMADGLKLAAEVAKGPGSLEDLGLLLTLRRQGLSQRQAAQVLGVSRDQVQMLEKRLAGVGVIIRPLGREQRRRKLRLALARELLKGQPALVVREAAPARAEVGHDS